MTSFTPITAAAQYELQSAVDATVTAFKAAQEHHGLQGLWFPLKEAWQHFCSKTTFQQDMWDAGYVGDAGYDLRFIKAYSSLLRGQELFVSVRHSFLGRPTTTVWLHRSLFLEHLSERDAMKPHRGDRNNFDKAHLWDFKGEGQ